MNAFNRCLQDSIVLLLLSPALATAAGQADERTIMVRGGAAMDSCAKFSEAERVRDSNYAVYMTWVQGFVTGYNAYASFDKSHAMRNLSPDTDVVEWSAWLKTYCAAHPLNVFGNASFELLQALGGNSTADNSRLYR